VAEFPNIDRQQAGKSMLDLVLSQLLKDVQIFDKRDVHAYERGNATQKVGYLDDKEGGISYSTVYGYLTAFALLKEWGAVDKAQKDARFGLRINCGEILYSQMPRTFEVVLGLSGTLPSPTFEQILRPYNFEYKSELPSTFKKTPATVKRPIVLRTDEELFDKIVEQKREFCDEKDGACVVILKDSDAVSKCRMILRSQKLAINVEVLTEEKDEVEIDAVLQRSASKGRMTLTTAFFARGTDFPPCDDDVRKTGGLMIIDTVPWALEAHEIQARGRTARQDDPGQYQQIWTLPDAKAKFTGITVHQETELMNSRLSDAVMFENWAKWFGDPPRVNSAGVLSDGRLGEHRIRTEVEIVKAMNKTNDAAMPMHADSAKLLEQLSTSKIDVLQKLNSRGKTVVMAVDVSASMSINDDKPGGGGGDSGGGVNGAKQMSRAEEQDFMNRLKREGGKIGTLTISLSWNTVRSTACHCNVRES
jgi:hypothetical protein